MRTLRRAKQRLDFAALHWDRVGANAGVDDYICGMAIDASEQGGYNLAATRADRLRIPANASSQDVPQMNFQDAIERKIESILAYGLYSSDATHKLQAAYHLGMLKTGGHTAGR